MKTVLRIAFTFLFSMVMISVANAQTAPVSENGNEQNSNQSTQQVNVQRTGVSIQVVEVPLSGSQSIDETKSPVVTPQYTTEAEKLQYDQELNSSSSTIIGSPEGNIAPTATTPEAGSGNPNGVPDYMMEAPAVPQESGNSNNEK